MTEDPGVARAAALAALGQREQLDRSAVDELAAAATTDPDPRVRAAALGAIARAGGARAHEVWGAAVADADAVVRRRAANLAPGLGTRRVQPTLVGPLSALLTDPDVTVVEAAAFALGELDAAAVGDDVVAVLAETATGHRDPIAREAAVAAIGALGATAGLPAVLAACRDKPAVRRRAVLALAPFRGPNVDAALAAALEDNDWQVRQAAEDLTT